MRMWVKRLSIAVIAICVIFAGGGNTVWGMKPVQEASGVDGLNQEKSYKLGDENIITDTGVSDESGTTNNVFEEGSGNGFPYERFQITLAEHTEENAVLHVNWSGESNNAKTYLYAYNTTANIWEKIDATQTINGEMMTLSGDVLLKNHLESDSVQILVQNGEGYTPAQYEPGAEKNSSINEAMDAVPTYNVDDTPRETYDFTFVAESDTQYYNEDYDGNRKQKADGLYLHQLNIHNWILANRARMNIQYLFHTGDIIDDEPNTIEWEQANAAYLLFDNTDLPYGILAGNHDVGHNRCNYSNFSTYFGANRYEQNAWYGDSYEDNRGHYDLITVDGIDFIMIYMGWGIGDDEINWLNEVLERYPERKAILNFHEYLSNEELSEIPQRIYDEVVAANENVCMVLSGHYHNAKTTVDTFTNADGTTRKVYNLLFDYQGLAEGGAGYIRLMHFDLVGGRIVIRTYTPSYGGDDMNNYGDYDAMPSSIPNEGNDLVIAGADLEGAESLEIAFADLGITPKVKVLKTTGLEVDAYSSAEYNTQSNATVNDDMREIEEGTDENGMADGNELEADRDADTGEMFSVKRAGIVITVLGILALIARGLYQYSGKRKWN